MLSLRAELSDPFSEFDFGARQSVLVAVSGGSDSTALMLSLKAFLDRHAPATRLVAATVDHRLRPESADEARLVAQLAGKLGIAHLTLAWQGAKPATGIAAAAREARYRLLADAAGRIGTDLIVTGHTADDQAETVAMRRTRGAGRGLSGMAPATLFKGRHWIARPLLGQRRAALRTFLMQSGVSWIDDPSNVAEASERARLRVRMDETQIEELLSLGRCAAQRRAALGAAAADAIRAHVACQLPGLVRISTRALLEQEPESAIYTLRILLATVGGAEQLPDAERVAAMLGRLRPDARRRATLSRCVVDRRGAETYLYRELRGIAELTLIEAGSEAVWDGRYSLCASRALDGFAIASAGSSLSALAVATQDVPALLERHATAALPWLRRRDVLALPANRPELLTPQLGARHGLSVMPVAAPWARFLPAFDLDCARAVAALIGAAAVPAAPWRGHIVTRA